MLTISFDVIDEGLIDLNFKWETDYVNVSVLFSDAGEFDGWSELLEAVIENKEFSIGEPMESRVYTNGDGVLNIDVSDDGLRGSTLSVRPTAENLKQMEEFIASLNQEKLFH